MEIRDLVERDPEIMSGTPVFRGTRVPVQTLFDYLKGGDALGEFLDDFPTVTREQAKAILKKAEQILLIEQETRYQGIVDVLLDSGLYDLVCFDEDPTLESPYRGIAERHTNYLLTERDTKQDIKWPDIVAISGDLCEIVIEEEKNPKRGRIEEDIDTVTRAKYLWTKKKYYSLANPYLFVLIDGSGKIVQKIYGPVGTFKQVIVCAKSDFRHIFEKYYLSSR